MEVNGLRRTAVVLAALVGLLGLAVPAAQVAFAAEPVPQATSSPFEAPGHALVDLVHARPGAAAAVVTVAPPLPLPPTVAATLFALAALLFVALRAPIAAAGTIERPAPPPSGRAPPRLPNA
ncbi:MAG TPA: hypothetical protein VGD67_12490 [Pseudonocardiaceae bacterium]